MFNLKNVDGTISSFEDNSEFIEARNKRNKVIVETLFKNKKNWRSCSEKNNSVYFVEYKGFTILFIYGSYNDAFGLILKGENPICTLQLQMYGQKVLQEGIDKINEILGIPYGEYELE